MTITKFACAGFAGISLATAMVPAALAESPAEFYKSKGIKLLVSHPPGGGYDIYARFFGRHLKRFVPGNPTVVVQNMPGAGGIAMTNAMFAQQPKDGSVIGLGPGQLATNALMGMTGTRYDARRLSWIGSMNAEVALATAWHTSPVKTAQDLFTKELVVGSGGTADLSTVCPTALKNVLGMKFKVVSGYRGSAGQMLAMERGEIAGIGGFNYGSLKSARPKWLTEKKVSILLQFAFDPHAELPNVPTLDKLARTQEQKDILALAFRPQQMGRAIFGPPAIPADRLAVLRAAFDAFVKDPAVLAESGKAKIEMYHPMRGEDMAKLVDTLHKSSPEIVKKASLALVPEGSTGSGKKK